MFSLPKSILDPASRLPSRPAVPSFFVSKRARHRVIRMALVFGSFFMLVWWLLQPTAMLPPNLPSLNVKPYQAIMDWSKTQGARPASPGGYPMSRAIEQQAMASAVNAGFETGRPHSVLSPLTPSEELAALLHFLVSTSHSSLPPSVLSDNYSPSTTPLLSEWILDFEPGPAGAKRDATMRSFKREVWEEEAKLVVLGKMKWGATWANDIVSTLKKEYRVPPAEILLIDLDSRVDSDVLEAVLHRLLGPITFPTVLLGGISVGNFEEFKMLHHEGRLGPMLQSAGVRVVPIDTRKAKIVKRKQGRR